MNYIESKINFEKKYSNIDLDLVIDNFIKEKKVLMYEKYFNEMKELSQREIINICIDFFSTKEEKLYKEVFDLLSSNNICFVNNEDMFEGRTVFENGDIKCLVVLKNNLYDLFILVHELTHYLTISTGRKDEYMDEFMLFSEVLPFRMEEELILFLKDKKEYFSDLEKCIKIRESVLSEIINHLFDYKDNLIEDVDVSFRYLISIIYKNRVIGKLSDAIINFGNLDIKEIIDFSI